MIRVKFIRWKEITNHSKTTEYLSFSIALGEWLTVTMFSEYVPLTAHASVICW